MKMHKDLLLESIFCKKKSIFCHDKTNMTKQTSNHPILLSIIKCLDVLRLYVIGIWCKIYANVLCHNFFKQSILFWSWYYSFWMVKRVLKFAFIQEERWVNAHFHIISILAIDTPQKYELSSIEYCCNAHPFYHNSQ